MRIAIAILVAINVFFAGMILLKMKPGLSHRSNWLWPDRWERSPFKN